MDRNYESVKAALDRFIGVPFGGAWEVSGVRGLR